MGSCRILVLGLVCFWPFLFSHPGIVHIFVLSVYGRAYDTFIVFGFCVFTCVRVTSAARVGVKVTLLFVIN